MLKTANLHKDGAIIFVNAHVLKSTLNVQISRLSLNQNALVDVKLALHVLTDLDSAI
jgi:hypothetical protein